MSEKNNNARTKNQILQTPAGGFLTKKWGKKNGGGTIRPRAKEQNKPYPQKTSRRGKALTTVIFFLPKSAPGKREKKAGGKNVTRKKGRGGGQRLQPGLGNAQTAPARHIPEVGGDFQVKRKEGPKTKRPPPPLT